MVKLEDYFSELTVKGTSRDSPDLIQKDYLLKLNQIFGPKKAISVVSNYSLSDLFRGEVLLDMGEFKDSPRTIKQKLNQIQDVLYWNSKLDSLDTRLSGNYMDVLTDTFEGAKKINERLINEGLTGWFLFRDVISGVPQQLLEKYGVPVTDEAKKAGWHIGKIYGGLKTLPNVSTEQLLDFIIDKEKNGDGIYEYGIEAGFDDVFTAMEASPKNGDGGRTAQIYLRNGFTSLEQIRSIDVATLKKLEQSFSFRGELNSGTYHRIHFNRLVSSKIKGNPSKVNEFLELAGQNDASDYLKAFDGDLVHTRRIFKFPEEERPSAWSIEYVRHNFYMKKQEKIPEFKQLLEEARELDSVPRSIFGVRGLTKVLERGEIFQLKLEYDAKVAEYRTMIGNDTAKFDEDKYKSLKDFEGDARFLMNLGFGERELAQKLSGQISYDDFEKLRFDGGKDLGGLKARVVTYLLDEGVNLTSMQELFNAYSIKGQTLDFLQKLGKGMSLDDKFKIMDAHVSVERAKDITSNVNFVAHDIPYSFLAGLEAHDISGIELRNFIDAQGIEHYRGEDGFDALGMIKDIRDFYNRGVPEVVVSD